MFQDLETIRINEHGVWLSNGEEITHVETLRGFKRHLKRDENGYFIQIGVDSKRIEVEDTAYFVEQVFPSENQIKMRLSDETTEILDLKTLSYEPSRLVCKIKDGKETARFLPHPYHELLLLCDSEDSKFILKVGNQKVTLS